MKNVKLLNKYTQEMKLRGFALNTQRQYISAFNKYLDYYSGEDFRYISLQSIKNYLEVLFDYGASNIKLNWINIT